MSDHRHPLVELTLTRLLEFIRNPGAVFWVFVFPVVLAVVLGIAFREQPPTAVRIAIVGDGAEEVASRLRASAEGAPGDEGAVIEAEQASHAAGARALRDGRVDLLVRADRDPDGAIALTYRFDPMRPDSRNARLRVDGALQGAFGRGDVLATSDEAVEETGARYIDFLVPGLIGMNIMGSCMWGIGYAIVDTRKRRLLKRFAATPMHRSHFLLSFMLSRLLFLAIEVVALLAFGWLAFDVQVQGSVLGIGVAAFAGAFAFSGIAALVASRTDSTEVASGWMNFVMMPMWLLSGAFFDYSRFPDFSQPLIRMLPLTSLNDALRSMINQGASLTDAWLELGLLITWGLVGFGLALRIFRWK